MRNNEECCGKCKHHYRANEQGDWICENPDSDNEGVWTDYEDWCPDFEER